MAVKHWPEWRVDELQNAANLILVPEITLVLRGTYRMQGPLDETDQEYGKNMILAKVDKRSGKRSMRQKVNTRAESGTCNVCSAPCSSCMHLKLASVGSKGGELFDETFHVATASQNSVNDDQEHTTSEASNLLSVNLCHDSLSENAESKVKPGSSDVLDTSVESKILPNLIIRGTFGGDQLGPKLQSSSEQRIFSNMHSKPIEGLDDNISCVSIANDASTVFSYCRKNIDRKNLLGNLGSVSGSGQEECGEAASNSANGKNSAAKNSVDEGLSDEDAVVKGTVKAALALCPKMEAEDKDSGDQPDECTNQIGQEKKSKQSVELPNLQEPALRSVSGEESYESEIMELDVKVCDICGDAGREDLLAICSRCSDGAEHTYCTREMLQKVPKGDWLCEECKLAEEIESQKQGPGVEENIATRTSIQSSRKRHAENPEVLSSSKRRAFETTSGSPKASNSGRTAAISRESSFKSLDSGKVKPAYHYSLGNYGKRTGMPVETISNTDLLQTVCQSSTGLPFKSIRGALSKSNSFNALSSKPKVKLVDEVPQRLKGDTENSSHGIKKGQARMMSKSMSFKAIISGRANAFESKVKILPSKFSHMQEIKGLKPVRDRNAFERKNSLRLDCLDGISMAKVDQKLTPRGDGSTPRGDGSTPRGDSCTPHGDSSTPRGDSSIRSAVSNSKEFKVSHSDKKLGNLMRSNSIMARRGTEFPVISARASSANGNSNTSAESRVKQVALKDEPSSSSGVAERSSKQDNGNFLESSACSREFYGQSEKTKESSLYCLRASDGVSTRNVTCLKCKEVGHAAECCSASPQKPGVDVPMTRSAREVQNGSKPKAELEAAILKKPDIYRKKLDSSQRDGLPLSNVDGSLRIVSKGQFPALNKIKDVKCDGEATEKQASSGALFSESHKQSSSNNVKQFDRCVVDGCFCIKAEDMNCAVHCVGKLTHASASTSLIMKVPTMPEHEYVWQGAFEVCKSARNLESYGGAQAHLSTSASPKVFEVVKRFPQSLSLDEVPRLSTWPRQFNDDGAKEDNIALFFFAKDVESFEKYYKGLVDNMIRKDMALKGSLGGVDLLIFPSTLLPKGSQHWNMLFFLWGVFRGRREECSESLKKVTSNMDVVRMDKPNSSAVMSVCNDSGMVGAVGKESSASDGFSEEVSGSDAPIKQQVQPNLDIDKKLSTLRSSSEQQDSEFSAKSWSKSSTKSPLFCIESRCPSPSIEQVGLVECKPDVEFRSSTQSTATISSSNGMEEMQVKRDVLHHGDDASPSQVCSGANQDSCGRGSNDVWQTRDGINCGKIKLERDLNEDIENSETEGPLRDLNSEGIHNWQTTSRKRQYLDLSNAVHQTSASTSDKMQLGEVAGMLTDSEIKSKKSNTGFSGLFGSGGSRDGVTLGDRLDSPACDLASISSFEDKSWAVVHDEKVILEKFGSDERYFFPVDSHNRKDSHLEGNSVFWKESSSDGVNQFCDDVPNLELALGAEKKSTNNGMLPFLVEMVDKNKSRIKPHDNMTDKEEEDGDLASLSLSLSCPFPNKEQTKEPALVREQLLPERCHVNTSLFLFQASDK